MNNENKKDYVCPVKFTTAIFSGKYKPEIITMLSQEAKFFGEIQKKLVSVTPRALSLALKGLEKDGIILRRQCLEYTPVRVEYCLSEKGKTLLPIVKDMFAWGLANMYEKDN